MLIILDNIRSIHNVGSIFRTSDAVGIEKIYLAGITPAPVDRFGLKNKALAKVSLGAENFIKWEKVKNTANIIDILKEKGYTVCIIEQDKHSTSIFDKRLKKLDKNKIVMVMGAEVNGISAEILAKADYILEIPMFGKKESLNVSVAFGIAVYIFTIN